MSFLFSNSEIRYASYGFGRMRMMKRLILLAPLLFAGCVFYERPVGWTPERIPLTPDGIAEMKRAGDSDASIRKALEFHGVEYKLSSDDLVMLKDAGASDALLTSAASAPVKTPQEARPIYDRRSYHRGCYCHHSAAPFYFATALSLNYVFGRHWGCRR